MNRKRFATLTLVAVLLCNALLLTIAYVLAPDALQNVWVTFVAAGVVVSLGLWFAIYQIGKAHIEAPSRTEPVRAEAPTPTQPSATSAIQILSLLQRKGRLIDFLQEDLQRYDDAQIGAAVRNVHEGCKEALDEYVHIEPIFAEPEGSEVTVEPGFDARAIRLTGNIAGDPPFSGALQHRGWRITDVDLPALTQADDRDRILAAAEVEVSSARPTS